jgi:hypothetical protein
MGKHGGGVSYSALAMLAMALLSGCSFQQRMDAVLDRQRQGQLVATARTLCIDPQVLRSQFRPDIWNGNAAQFVRQLDQCPPGGGDDWELATFRFNTAVSADGTPSRQEYAIVVAGGDEGPWTETELRYESVNDQPAQIIGWTVRRRADLPESLGQKDSWERFRLYSWFGGVALLALAVGLLTWAIRRRRQGKRLTDA